MTTDLNTPHGQTPQSGARPDLDSTELRAQTDPEGRPEPSETGVPPAEEAAKPGPTEGRGASGCRESPDPRVRAAKRVSAQERRAAGSRLHIVLVAGVLLSVACGVVGRGGFFGLGAEVVCPAVLLAFSGLSAYCLVAQRRQSAEREEDRLACAEKSLRKEFERDMVRARSECERLVEKHVEQVLEKDRATRSKIQALQCEREKERAHWDKEIQKEEEHRQEVEDAARDLGERVAELERALAERGEENSAMARELERAAAEMERLRGQGIRYFDRITTQLRGSLQIVAKLARKISLDGSDGRVPSGAPGAAEEAVGRKDGGGSEVTREIVERVTQLDRFVDEVIELCRVESSAISFVFSEVNVKRLTGKCVQEVADTAARQGLHVSSNVSDRLPPVLTDIRLATKILRELLSNAVQCTPKGGRVGITARITSEESSGAESRTVDSLCIEVSDTGPGIPQEDHERIFKPFEFGGQPRFTQTDATAGLGLTLARSYARLLGGDVLLDRSEPGRGSVFTASLPVKVCSRVEY